MAASTRIPKQLIWIVAIICVLPFLFHLSGVDWGTSAQSFDMASASRMTEDQRLDAMFFRLSGAFTHTMLEWSAFCAAIFTVLLAFIHFSISRVGSRVRGEHETFSFFACKPLSVCG